MQLARKDKRHDFGPPLANRRADEVVVLDEATAVRNVFRERRATFDDATTENAHRIAKGFLLRVILGEVKLVHFEKVRAVLGFIHTENAIIDRARAQRVRAERENLHQDREALL